MKRHLLLLLGALLLNVSNTFAWTTYYYGKVTASASGNGKVYASTSSNEPATTSYDNDVTVTNSSETVGRSDPAPSRTIHLWAKANDVDYEREVFPTISWAKTAGDNKLLLNGNSGSHITAKETGQTDKNKNYTVTATFTEPTAETNQIADGIYYLYNPALDKFASKAKDWGTSLAADDYGLPVRIIMTADGYNKIQFLDFNDPTLYWHEQYWVWSDHNTDDNMRRWAFIPKGDGSYHIRNKFWSDDNQNTQYLYVWTNEAEPNNMYRMAANSADQATMTEDQISWQLKSQAERDQIIANRLEAQNIATAAEAGFTVSSTADLESQMAGMIDFNATPADITFKQSSGTPAWTFTPTREGSTYTTTTDGTQIWQGVGKFTRTLTDLEPGLYKVTVQGYLRDGGFDAVKATYAKGISKMSTGYVRANGKHVQMKPWHEEATLASNNPNSMGEGNAAFGAGKYLNTLYTYVGTDGQLTLEVGNEAFTGDNWMMLGDVTVTNYTTLEIEEGFVDNLENIGDGPFQIPTTDTYYEALNTARSDAENATTAAQKRSAITSMRSAIANFKANATVNAPSADQKFTITSKSAGLEWTDKVMTIKGAQGETDANNVTLGYTDDAGSIYPQALTFTPVGGTRNGFKLSYTRGDGTEMYLCTGTAVGNTVGWSNDQIRVTTTVEDALTFQVEPFTGTDGIWYLRNTVTDGLIGNGNNSFYTGGVNYELTLAEAEKASVDFTVKEGYHFSTLMLPFDAGIPTGVEAYTVDGIQQGSIVLNEVSAFEANVPYILWVEDEAQLDETVEGWGAAFTDATVTNDFLTGTCTTDNTVTVPAGMYVLSAKTYTTGTKVGFYRVQEGKEPKLPRNRAYFDATSASAGSAPVKEAYFFGPDDDETGLSDMLTDDREVEGIYDVKGMRLPRMQKGVNIIRMTDGTSRRVMVK